MSAPGCVSGCDHAFSLWANSGHVCVMSVPPGNMGSPGHTWALMSVRPAMCLTGMFTPSLVHVFVPSEPLSAPVRSPGHVSQRVLGVAPVVTHTHVMHLHAHGRAWARGCSLRAPTAQPGALGVAALGNPATKRRGLSRVHLHARGHIYCPGQGASEPSNLPGSCHPPNPQSSQLGTSTPQPASGVDPRWRRLQTRALPHLASPLWRGWGRMHGEEAAAGGSSAPRREGQRGPAGRCTGLRARQRAAGSRR